MNHIVKRIAILSGVFAAALGVFFFANNRWNSGQDQAVYMDMEAASLPSVTVQMLDRDMNRLYGYRQEMNTTAAGETLTILPEDRALTVRITEGTVTGISYEVRSMDRERLVERTEVSDWWQTDDGILAVLPIQNLLTKEREYQLKIQLDTENFGPVYYYTRILWTDAADNARAMVDLAADFSMKTFDYEQARSLTTYLETSPSEDNSTFGHTSIHSSFSQLTWGGLKMELVGEMETTLQELDGIMGQIKVSYQVSRTAEQGNTESYEVTDYYTVKWTEKRIYLMDFDRKMNQIFSGERILYSGKRILMGIGNDDVIQTLHSKNNRYLAFVFNRDLWCYDQQDGKSVNIFSFRDGTDESGRSDYDQHNIQILDVADDGTVEFLVYGYMNRGNHEGNQGLGLYSYSKDGAVTERFFADSSRSYDEIRQDIEKLSYLNENGMFYVYQDGAVYGIDLSSKEYMVVADGLTEETSAISSDRTRLAWLEGQDAYEAKMIHVFNMATGEKQEIQAPEGSVLRALGFVQGDFVYGLAHPEDIWMLNGRAEDLPMYAIQIVDKDLNVQTRYEKQGFYLGSVEVEDSRIHIQRLVKNGDLRYAYADQDTIVCNEAAKTDIMDHIGWFASEVRRKVYFVQTDQEISRTIKISVARKLTYDQSETLEFQSGDRQSRTAFYAYGRGKLQGIYGTFSQAVQAAYPVMGIVTDQDQQILWDRVNRSTIRTIRSPQETAAVLTGNLSELSQTKTMTDGTVLIDARGCTLNQMLYFIGQGMPVAAYTDSGDYVLLYGYDQYNISVLNPATGETYKMGLNDGADYFNRCGNDFICGKVLPQ
mgnify:CR=1 FL=1